MRIIISLLCFTTYSFSQNIDDNLKIMSLQPEKGNTHIMVK